MQVFISYATKDGLELAREASKLLEGAEHKPWFWEHDKTPGALLWEEIRQQIMNSDVVLYICTSSSKHSRGQQMERNYALTDNKHIVPVAIDTTPIPAVLTAFTYERWAREEFTNKCRTLARRLPDVLSRIQRFMEGVPSKVASRSITERHAHISDLNTRTADLDSKRVDECKNELLRSYLGTTMPPRVTRFIEQRANDLEGIGTIGLRTNVGLEEFNDPSYGWGPYFSDLGRKIATGEENYLLEAIKQQVTQEDIAVSRSCPDFKVLELRIENLKNQGTPPNIMFAPIELLPAFHKFFRPTLDWSGDGEELSLGDVKVKIHWSVQDNETPGFIVFHSNAGTWHIVPDPESGKAISIGLGVSRLYPDRVEFNIATLVKYTVDHPNAFCVIPLSD